mmetsp:Transcript_24400/g.29502  ORF Transcript_24400/g.29502 Transcript_24400/m.29502 type:complete len:95 (-) Transcript_24400:356-640(-)
MQIVKGLLGWQWSLTYGQSLEIYGRRTNADLMPMVTHGLLDMSFQQGCYTVTPWQRVWDLVLTCHGSTVIGSVRPSAVVFVSSSTTWNFRFGTT